MANQLDIIFISVALIIPWIAVQMKLDILRQLEMYRHSFNLTRKFQVDHNEDILIFARVPKTASLTINAMLERLTDKNNFTAFSKIDGMPTESKVCIIILSFSSSVLKCFNG